MTVMCSSVVGLVEVAGVVDRRDKSVFMLGRVCTSGEGCVMVMSRFPDSENIVGVRIWSSLHHIWINFLQAPTLRDKLLYQRSNGGPGVRGRQGMLDLIDTYLTALVAWRTTPSQERRAGSPKSLCIHCPQLSLRRHTSTLQASSGRGLRLGGTTHQRLSPVE